MKVTIYDFSHKSLNQLITGWDFPRYRADQVWAWLYKHKVISFDEMTNIPIVLRQQLNEQFHLSSLETVSVFESVDGETKKYLLKLPDGQLIETVLMEYSGNRRTACISTQAGCAMGCVFCATGQMGFARNLSIGEIIQQAIYVARILEGSSERLSNVVLMGMGEPFHNYEASLGAIRRLMDDDGLNIGQRHITISTVGLVPGIRRFSQEKLQVRLAISLHAATDKERSALLPINERYPIKDLMGAIKEYIDITGRRVTFEWAAIAGENDTPEEAHQLSQLLRGLMCHVNIIPLNPTQGYQGMRAPEDRIIEFVEILESYNIPATVRVRRGIDINAGCGQLKANILKNA